MNDKYDPILKTEQSNINRQFKKRIDELEISSAPYDDTEIKGDISDIKDDVGNIQEAIGDESTEGSIVANINALETAIGDESTEGTILARIKALEDAQ